MNTIEYRTRTEFKGERHATCREYWPVAMDIGYSAVKCYFPNGHCCFPSYAKHIGNQKDIVGMPPVKGEILYIDGETGEVWRVGEYAQKSVSQNDTNETDAFLFSRHRYESEMFQVLARTGLGFSMMNTAGGPYTKLPCYLQTGLPPAYLKGSDKHELIGVLAGHHKFTIKTGDKNVDFDFTIKPEDVDVMAQPEGTLMSLSMNNDARSTKMARDYFASHLLIADAGFETVDLYELHNRTISSRTTLTNLGMHEILSRTIAKLQEACGGIQIDQITIQNALETGKVSKIGISPENRRPHRIEYEIAPYLEQAVNEVFESVSMKIWDNVKDSIDDYKYLVLTGGAFAPWETSAREFFGDLTQGANRHGLQILMGNENCKEDTDLIYTNVRGYYLCMIARLRKREANA